MSTNRPTPSLPNWLVTNRNFVLLWFAYGVAAMGDHISEQALLKLRGAMEREDSTRIQALISFGFFLPFVIFGPIAGWWSDRFSRKYTMLTADLIRAVIVFSIAILVRFLASLLPPPLQDYSIVIPLGLLGLFAAFFSPARQALLPTLIRDDQLVRANAMTNALGTIGAIIGTVLGGQIVQHFDEAAAFHTNTITYLASAAAVLLINMRNTRAVPHPPLEGIWQPLQAGFRFVKTHRSTFDLIVLGTIFWACAGVIISVVPAIVKVVAQTRDYGAPAIFRGLIGIGLAFGAAIMTIVGPAMPLQVAIMAALIGGGGWICILTGAYIGQVEILAGISLFCVGGAGAALLVTVMTGMQRFVPDAWRGRVFGVSDMCTVGAMVAVSAALGLPEIPNLDQYVPYLLLATAALMIGTGLIAMRQYARHPDSGPIVGLIWQFNRFFTRFWLRLQRDGHCTVPRTGPVIIAANHTAGVDPMAIISECPHRLPSFIVAQEYYNVPIAHTLMKWGRSLPIDRKNPGKSFLVQCLRLLKDGGCLGIFPQGTFEEPGKEMPEAKSGVGVLALRTGAAVIPCHISGTRYFDNPFLAFFVRHRVRIKFGPPVDLTAFAGREKDKRAPEEATEVIWNAIQALAPLPANATSAMEKSAT